MLDNVRKIGIFGGTLNPVHHGHLIMAENARERFGLDKVLFIPTGIPPHKNDVEVTSALHRFNMVKCALSGNPDFEASRLEIDRTGYSYTVDTLMSLKGVHGKNAMFYFIIGADVIPELVTWKNFSKVFEMCSFIAVLRPGYQCESFMAQVTELRERYSASISTVDVPMIDISSTNIRERIKSGASIKYLVPQCVEKYIYDNGLYNGH